MQAQRNTHVRRIFKITGTRKHWGRLEKCSCYELVGRIRITTGAQRNSELLN
jgi:hypothetical protein